MTIDEKPRQRRQAKNVKEGMVIGFMGRKTEVVKVVPPRSQHDGVQITTRYGLMRNGNGAHYSQSARVSVF